MKLDDKRRRPIRHGSFYGYTTHRCRCELCVQNWNQNQRRLRAKNREKYNAYARKWEHNNKARARESNTMWIGKNRYWNAFRHQLWKRGLTLDQFHAMYERQDFCCAICNQELDSKPTIDHCHDTKRIRGLLCMNCNLGLGHFKDDPARLTTAAQYLARRGASGVGYSRV